MHFSVPTFAHEGRPSAGRQHCRRRAGGRRLGADDQAFVVRNGQGGGALELKSSPLEQPRIELLTTNDSTTHGVWQSDRLDNSPGLERAPYYTAERAGRADAEI